MIRLFGGESAGDRNEAQEIADKAIEEAGGKLIKHGPDKGKWDARPAVKEAKGKGDDK